MENPQNYARALRMDECPSFLPFPVTQFCRAVTPVTTENSLPQEWQHYGDNYNESNSYS